MRGAVDAGRVTIVAQDLAWDAACIEQLERTLPVGEYDHVCDIHPNMVGQLVLVDANPAQP